MKNFPWLFSILEEITQEQITELSIKNVTFSIIEKQPLAALPSLHEKSNI